MERLIRPEQPGDEVGIRQLTARAFAAVEYSEGSEPAIVDALRCAGDLVVSLVTEQDGEIVGHIAFSPVSIDQKHDHWFGLGPISVAPEYQKQGIGRDLINAGLDELKSIEAKGCVLVGDPGYYQRFGFSNDAGLEYAGIDTQYVQQLALSGNKQTGIIRYCDSFESEIQNSGE